MLIVYHHKSTRTSPGQSAPKMSSGSGYECSSFTSKGMPRMDEKERLDAAVIGVGHCICRTTGTFLLTTAFGRLQTNNSSVVSKRSVERLYSKENDSQFFRYFVKKPQRRSPIINRGYWLRMQAVNFIVNSFIHKEQHSVPKKKVVVNFGCG
jgi:hypothetical protein